MAKGRPREFDTDVALDKAMLVFWRKGYRGASLDDLTEAMDINRPSLYAAFADKENLFMQVIDHYRRQFLAAPFKKFMAAKTLKEGLPEFLKSLINVVTSDKTPPGCMIPCLLPEDSCDSEVIRVKLADSLANADAAFKQVFEAHEDELNENLDAQEAARLLTTLNQGMAIRARAGANEQTLQRIAQTFVGLLLRD